MKYNLKIKDYPDNLQISYYDQKIKRNEGNDEADNDNDKYNIGDIISDYWYNSTTGKMEIIPDGYKVGINPFTGEECFVELESKSVEEKQREHVLNVLRSNRRMKQNVYEIARGSKWELFVTLTIADEEIRNDLEKAKKRVGKRINKIREKIAPELKYLLIFERHPTSGAWHVHGLFKDIDGLNIQKAFNPYTGELINKNDKQVYNLSDFNCIGFSTATEVEDNNRVTKYILKYITKEMSFDYPGKKSYLCSQHLPRGDEVLLEVESADDIEAALEKYLGYLPVKTHASKGFNIWNGTNIIYEQYRKK